MTRVELFADGGNLFISKEDELKTLCSGSGREKQVAQRA